MPAIAKPIVKKHKRRKNKHSESAATPLYTASSSMASATIDQSMRADDNVQLLHLQNKLTNNIAVASEIVRKNPTRMRHRRREQLIEMFENFDDDIVDFLCELERGDLVDINQVLGQDMRAYE